MLRLIGCLVVWCAIAAALVACDSGPIPSPTPTVPPIAPTHVTGDLQIESAKEIGVLPNPPQVRARDGGATVLVRNQVLWTFGDTIFTAPNEQGINGISNSAAFAPLTNPFTFTLTNTATVDATGAPLPLLPYTEEEIAYNRERGDKGDDRYALWPSSAVRSRGGSGLIFYARLIIKPGDFNFETVGVGLAEVGPESTVARRDPGFLFEASDPMFDDGAVVGGSFVYVYACDLVGPLDAPCKVARVPAENVRERPAYRFWDGSDWVEEIEAAIPVFTGPTSGVTVSWNPYLGSYLATYGGMLSTKVLMRTAPAPEGPWSDPAEAFTGEQPIDADWNYNAYEHPELSKDGGRTTYVTYYRPTGTFDGEMRIVEVTFK